MGLIVFVSTWAVMLINFVVSLKKTYIFMNIQVFTGYIDAYINVICLYMQYNFADKYYYICCKRFHTYIEKKFDRRVDAVLLVSVKNRMISASSIDITIAHHLPENNENTTQDIPTDLTTNANDNNNDGNLTMIYNDNDNNISSNDISNNAENIGDNDPDIITADYIVTNNVNTS